MARNIRIVRPETAKSIRMDAAREILAVSSKISAARRELAELEALQDEAVSWYNRMSGGHVELTSRSPRRRWHRIRLRATG